jgi:hypothetical protein
VHYDGFAVRSFVLQLDAEEWLLQSTTQAIHDTRTDLVLGE